MKTFKNGFQVLILFASLLLYNVSVLAANTPENKEISNAVENELLFNATTPSYLIDVQTNGGIVTLTGSINNILAQDRAVKIARTVKGVRGVINNITVDAPFRTNAVLENNVDNALFSDPATDSYEIKVDANNGQITLSGTVESWQEKQLSEYVAKGVLGVKSIENNISVNYTSNRSDYEIQKDIEQSLKNDVRIDNALIDVAVNNGKVKLSGAVGSANEKTLAYSKAWTAGTNSVNNKNLKVTEWARNENLRKGKYVSKTDTEIKDAVVDAFIYDPRVFSFNPDVSVLNGVVTLTGEVNNLKAKKAAEQNAKNVVGVFRVKNYLKVRPVFIPADSDLEADIESAMLKNPVVEKWEIDVTANNGVVYLNGSVDSYFEKTIAEDLASKTKGVLAVENNLSVFDNNDFFFYDYYGWNTYYPPYHVDIADTYNTDEVIKQNIVDELWWSPYVNQNEVDVNVENGKAILEGEVNTKREKLFAEINALEGGAAEVQNNLIVDYAP